MINKWKNLLLSVVYCVRLSFQASAFYTMARVIGNVLLALIRVANIYPLKFILDGISQKEGIQIANAVQWLALMAGLNILRILIENLDIYMQRMHDELFQKLISERLLEKAVDADLGVYDAPDYYDFFETIQADAFSFPQVLGDILEWISAMFSFVGVFFVLGQKNLLGAVLIVVVNVPSALCLQRCTKLLYQYDLSQVKNKRKQNYVMYVATQRSYAQEIRCFYLGEYLKQKYKYLFLDIFSKKKGILRKRAFMAGLFGMLPEIVNFLLLLTVLYGVLEGKNTVGDFSWYAGICTQMVAYIRLLSILISNIYDNQLKLDHMREFRHIQVKKIVDGNDELEEIHSIVFDHVGFQYPGSDRMALFNINFTIQKGECILLAGVNGSGKSTMIKLLLRLYDATQGEIRINGKDIKDYNLKSLRMQFGVYFQNSVDFAFTLKENMVFDEQMDDGLCSDILNRCYGGDILSLCGNNLHVAMGKAFDEDGMEFSIGQKQKIAIARALCHDRSCYVLDEPSSSLDPIAENVVYDYIKEKSEGKITIFISHRLSFVKFAEYVLVMEDGKLVEQGKPQELLSRNGKFFELYHMRE